MSGIPIDWWKLRPYDLEALPHFPHKSLFEQTVERQWRAVEGELQRLVDAGADIGDLVIETNFDDLLTVRVLHRRELAAEFKIVR